MNHGTLTPNQPGPSLNPISSASTPPPQAPQWSQLGGASFDASFQEASTTTLEWRITGLRSIFEQTRGDNKSRVVKSALFGGGRWQVLWYPNAGGPVGSEWTSLYLSCEPRPEEYESHPSLPSRTTAPSSSSLKAPQDGPRFERKGVYSFKFSISSGDKQICVKEDAGHTFATEAQNWGWASYYRRDLLYFDNPAVRRLDYITITCSVSSRPEPPKVPDTVPRQLIPCDLVDVVGRLLDDESYSDVEFHIAPRRHVSHSKANAPSGRTIWANRTILSRAEYFETMLSSGFAEDLQAGVGGLSLDEGSAALDDGLPEMEDSDRSESEISDGEEDEGDEHFLSTTSPTQPSDSERTASSTSDAPAELVETTPVLTAAVPDAPRPAAKGEQRQGPRKTRVVIRDASHSTYFALLYFLYTDVVVFAPLTSSFHSSPPSFASDRRPSHQHHPSASSYRSFTSAAASTAQDEWSPAKARRQWIDEWCVAHPGRPRPASAKSVYILADKMGIEALKKKAFDHIVGSLTVDNIAHEAFSNFSAAYEDVRKVHVEYFLRHWKTIKDTATMQDIWRELRSGRHAGFEDVWPLIVSQLEYVPRPMTSVPAVGLSNYGFAPL